jgi:hypothetical protein
VLQGNGSIFTGRIQYTILRMADGTMVHAYLGRSMPDVAVIEPARVTFMDEIMQSE